MLQQFLDQRCARCHLSATPLRDLYGEFLAWLPEADRPGWSRARFIAALGAAGVEIATVARADHAIGLSLSAAK